MAEPDNVDVVGLHKAVSIELIRNTGAYAVKVVKGDKGPHKGWDPKSNTKQKSDLILKDALYEDTNIGIHLFDSVVDVDIDTNDPVLFAALEMFLPSCPHVWGRASKPRSHRVYMVQSADKFIAAEHPFLRRLEAIPEARIELRGGTQMNGKYSVLPGSLHPEGELYEWADLGRARSSPAVAELEVLLRAIRMAGAIAVLAPHWVEGARNQLNMALSGFLYKAYEIADSAGENLFALDYDQAKMFLESLMEITGDDEEDKISRIKSFHATWRKGEEGAPVTGASTIAEITGDDDIVRKLYVLLCDSPDVSIIESYINRFCIWQGPGLVIDLERVGKSSTKPFMTRQQFTNSFGHDFVRYGDKKRLVADLLWGLKAANRVAGITFEPGAPSMVEGREGRKINEWGGFAIEPYDGHVKDEDVQPFIGYVRDVVASGDPKVYEWIMGWVAHIFKEPTKKTGTCLVLVGIPGAGKSFIGHHFIVPIIGAQHATVTNDINNIVRNFNVQMDNKIFIQGDEATRNSQVTSAARMRALITDPTKWIEPKGVDAYEKPNHTRFLFTSNDEENAMLIQGGLDDRRYTVVNVPPTYKADIDYWLNLVEWAGDNSNLSKVHRWLLDFEYDRRFIGRPLVTAAKVDMQQRSQEPFDAWLSAMVARGHPLDEANHDYWYDAVVDTEKAKKNTSIDRTGWPKFIRLEALEKDYTSYSRKTKGPDHLSPSQIKLALKKRGLITGEEDSIQFRVNGWDEVKRAKVDKRTRVYYMPPLSVIEDYLVGKYGIERQFIGKDRDEIQAEMEDKEF